MPAFGPWLYFVVIFWPIATSFVVDGIKQGQQPIGAQTKATDIATKQWRLAGPELIVTTFLHIYWFVPLLVQSF